MRATHCRYRGNASTGFSLQQETRWLGGLMWVIRLLRF